MKMFQEKHSAPLPTPRSIRRTCSNELYRTAKRLKQHIPPTLLGQAEAFYVRKVIDNLSWIAQNHSNRKLLADWWDEQISEEIAAMWNVDRERLKKAFRDAFGG
ncbi:dehydrogenase [Cohnella kolymensis]|uniref:Dehydrogenase n=1 Tax=Cohnella kolymensis TaxID=1590652 RepID=A0ABR5A790_9BACL|nr:hypothetical protein [Cohnella kolymensis]KIL36889.1 dehydrogenase [Cohnella kolymensis]